MIRFLTFLIFATALATGWTSCTDDDPAAGQETGQPLPPGTEGTEDGDGTDGSGNNNNPEEGNNEEGNNPEDDNAVRNKIAVRIGDAVFTATLSDNETAAAFKKRLPMTVRMDEQAGNEKYYYLPENLPANASRPETVRAGDLMLWGNNCLVLFYQTFPTSYSYARIGKIDRPEGLSTALGAGSVTVTFLPLP